MKQNNVLQDEHAAREVSDHTHAAAEDTAKGAENLIDAVDPVAETDGAAGVDIPNLSSLNYVVFVCRSVPPRKLRCCACTHFRFETASCGNPSAPIVAHRRLDRRPLVNVLCSSTGDAASSNAAPDPMSSLFANFSTGGKDSGALPPGSSLDASEDEKDDMEDGNVDLPEDIKKPAIMNALSDFFKNIKLPDLPKLPKFGKENSMTDEEAAAAGTEILERAGVDGLVDDDDEEKQKKYKKILILIGVSGLSVIALFLLWLLFRGGKSEGE